MRHDAATSRRGIHAEYGIGGAAGLEGADVLQILRLEPHFAAQLCGQQLTGNQRGPEHVPRDPLRRILHVRQLNLKRRQFHHVLLPYDTLNRLVGR